jgi:hypothetical protein
MNTAFFILSKLVGLALQIETWLAIGMALSLLGGMLARPRLARWSGGVTLAALLLISIFPMGELLLRPLEADFPPHAAPDQIDGIVVLGGVEDPRVTAFWGQPQLNAAAVMSDNHLGRCRQPPWPVGLDGRRACPSGGQPHRPD